MKRELRELIVLLLDAYKLFHKDMYPKNTVRVYSNITARASKHYKGNNKDYTIVFGSQRLVRKMKDSFDEFFALPEQEVAEFCKEQLSSFTGMDYPVDHIIYLHRLGKLPLLVKSLPEGTRCPIRVPHMTFYNTDKKCYWLTNYLETYISCETWALTTNATIANEYREIFEKWAMTTVGNTDFVPFQGHDFSMRGMGGSEYARMSGLAHLTSFCGSDTVPSYLDAQYYYDSGQNNWETMDIVATSVPATEHSVQCAHYNPEDGDELAYLDHILDLYPTGIVSIVCDGFDFWKFITEVAPQRKERILARDGKLVFRPDSGNIVDIICGDYRSGVPEHESKGAIEVLYDIWGGEVNSKGYIELNPKIGLIYGDSVTLQVAEDVCSYLANKGFASINWVAGIGSYTYQFNTRDSHGQAVKATYVEFSEFNPLAVDSPKIVGKNIFKDPATGDGMKKSAKGLLFVGSQRSETNRSNHEYYLVDEVSWEVEAEGELQVILEDGRLKNQTTLQEIRKRIKSYAV